MLDSASACNMPPYHQCRMKKSNSYSIDIAHHMLLPAGNNFSLRLLGSSAAEITVVCSHTGSTSGQAPEVPYHKGSHSMNKVQVRQLRSLK